MNKLFKAWISSIERKKWKRKFEGNKTEKQVNKHLTEGAFGKPKWMR